MNSRLTSEKRVVVVGSGGNIGSHLVSHLARMRRVSGITLIDKDIYEEKNLASQDITARDVGKPKVVVQARRLKKINPMLYIEPIADAVERVPLGKLRADVILACLDSRAARQHVNQFAWRLGVPLIDAGIAALGLLARVNVYEPGPDNPCLECAWDDRDYEALEQTYPCAHSANNVPATNAPSSLGALAAALQAIECEKLLRGQTDRVAIGKQVLIDASHHQHYVTSFQRNPNCRFGNHELWTINGVNGSITLREALALGAEVHGNRGSCTLGLEGKPFVTKLTCSGCGHAKSLLRLECSLRDENRYCVNCGEGMITGGFDLLEQLAADCVSADALDRPLHKLGLRPGDVFSVGPDSDVHYEITDKVTSR